MAANQLPEPWLRGGGTEVPAVPRAVLHALALAEEDLKRWCGGLSDEQIHARPFGLPPVAFHVRHIARSLDRLLTYAEGRPLRDGQQEALQAEWDAGGSRNDLFAELDDALGRSAARIRAFAAAELAEARSVGRERLPTTVAGLLVHVADHTQRHVGQAITTAKVVAAAPGNRAAG
jgi:uncharacterized damage-inducible protein DinB